MPEPYDLPVRLRARLARALDAVPEQRPLPEQAVYTAVGRRNLRRRPALALTTGAAALVALAALALTGLASTGSANPAVWTGRALSTIQLVRPSATQPSPTAAPPAPAPGSGPATSHAAPAAAPTVRRSPEPGGALRPTIPPGFVPLPTGGLPKFSPPPFPSAYPFPTPPGTSDFGHRGR